MKRYQSDHADSAKPELASPQQDLVLPDVIDRDKSLQPKVQASANGQHVDRRLDTGASDLILDQRTATRLGVQLLDRTWHSRGVLALGVQSRAGILHTLTIGSLVRLRGFEHALADFAGFGGTSGYGLPAGFP